MCQVREPFNNVSVSLLTCIHVHFLWLVCIAGEATSSLRRLTHSIQEPNVAKGYIKEHCFSRDGRVICSPFGNSARILSFNSQCDELSSCSRNIPSELCDLKTLISHKHAVVTCRFSPKHLLLSLGCLGGKVSFYEPKLWTIKWVDLVKNKINDVLKMMVGFSNRCF